MHQKLHFLQAQIRLDSRFFWSLLGAESIILSLLHHRLNFWGWPVDNQVLVILVVAPAFAFMLDRLVSPLWPALAAIPRRRWILFLVPAACISGLIAWHFLTMPEVGHRLEIIPAGNVQLRELRAAYGNAVPLSTFTNMPGWKLQGGLLVSQSAQPAPLQYMFYGPINEQIRVSFVVSRPGGQAQVTLDGRQADVNLNGADGDERRARLGTAYRWGFLNFLIVPLILTIDLLAALMLLTILWVMQEVTQDSATSSVQLAQERFLSHRNGLLLLCLLGLLSHAVFALAAPLVVSDDGPSYLQGAVYWIRFHTLDGVSSYRGPGTTFLFTPILLVFGRDPWGLKILLHLTAVACIALSYRIGWQLGRRRWFAFTAGMLTAVLPDLYAYSSYVLSETLSVFFTLLSCTLLISAMETPSLRRMAAASFAGSFAVLVRSESFLALLIGLGFILAKVFWTRKADHEGGVGPASAKRLAAAWQIAVIIVIAAAPPLAWSIHNERTYGFFGLSNYGGAVLYDGWIYFGEHSHLPITDPNSRAVRIINAVYRSGYTKSSNGGTAWDVYNSLLAHGYTSEDAFSILGQAAADSMRRAPLSTWRLLLIKLKQGFEPQAAMALTFSLPEESPRRLELNAAYFDNERPLVPSLISWQRFVNALIGKWYASVLTGWFWMGLTMLFICLYRRPPSRWLPLDIIALNSVFFPIIVGMALWRYILLGILLMPLFILAGIQSMGWFVQRYFSTFDPPD